MPYREDLEAALARATAAEQELAAARMENATDHERIAELERQLAHAKDDVRETKQRGVPRFRRAWILVALALVVAMGCAWLWAKRNRQLMLGWQTAVTTKGECPTGFVKQTYYTSAVGPALDCACDCTGTAVCSGTATLNHYIDAGCRGTPETLGIDVSAACQTPHQRVSIINGDSYTISNASLVPSECKALRRTVSHVPPATESMSVCTPVRGEMAPASRCLAHIGQRDCPSGFAHKTVVSEAIDDERRCDVCSCGAKLDCTVTSVLLDGDSSCRSGRNKPGLYDLVASSVCATATTPANFPLNATLAMSSAAMSAACSETSPSAATGTVKLDASRSMTICCP